MGDRVWHAGSSAALAERLDATGFLAGTGKTALAQAPATLPVDELDRADDEFEAFLLEVLSEFTIAIPEIGTVGADVPPVEVLTGNPSRAAVLSREGSRHA